MKPPSPPDVLRVLRSSMLVWLLTRVMYVVVLMVGVAFFGFQEGIHSALHPVWSSRLLLILLTAVLVHLDRTRAHEHLLQANFGVPAVWFPATSLVAASLSDLVLQMLVLTIGG